MQKIILFIVLTTFNLTFAQTKKKQILLIGTFHFANPGNDVAKINTFNVMSDKSQKELETISDKIKKFGPDKIFVEWKFIQQDKLDKFYSKNTDSLFKNSKNEITQLALRTAKKLNHKKLFAIDYNETKFPYDSLIKGMQEANQLDLLEKNQKEMAAFEKDQNQKNSQYSLNELLINYNTKEFNTKDINWYIGIANKAGKTDNFVGAYLVSEWYKRNLYIYSLIQKLTESKDDKIMVLLGASHAAMLREFIAYDPTFELVELETVLK